MFYRIASQIQFGELTGQCIPLQIKLLSEGPSFILDKLEYCAVTDAEMVADDGNSGTVPSTYALFFSYNNRLLNFRQGNDKRGRSIPILHRTDEARENVENLLSRSLNVFVKRNKHRGVCLCPLENSVVLLTEFRKDFIG